MEKISKNCMSLLVSNTEATISYISAFSPHLMQITSCFAASAAQSQVTSKTTTRFRTKLSKFCNFSLRLRKKQSKILDPPQMLLTITPQVERIK